MVSSCIFFVPAALPHLLMSSTLWYLQVHSLLVLGLLHSVQNFLQILINPQPSSHSFFQLGIGTLLLVMCVADTGNDSEDAPAL